MRIVDFIPRVFFFFVGHHFPLLKATHHKRAIPIIIFETDRGRKYVRIATNKRNTIVYYALFNMARVHNRARFLFPNQCLRTFDQKSARHRCSRIANGETSAQYTVSDGFPKRFKFTKSYRLLRKRAKITVKFL